MIEINIEEQEIYDETTQEFSIIGPWSLRLEHSLVSISKWESQWEKAFLGKGEKTDTEIRDYIRCMTISQNIPQIAYDCMSQKNIDAITDYINKGMTATWFPERQQKPSRETVTSELIYYWMISYSIPMECQKWHLNRLMTLIQVCNVKNDTGSKKMSKNQIADRNRKLNEARRSKFNSKG